MKPSQRNILIAIALILLCAALRVVNARHHLFNFAPVAALSLFSGAVIKDKRLALLMPLLASFAGDFGLARLTNTQGFYGVSQAFVYAPPTHRASMACRRLLCMRALWRLPCWARAWAAPP